MIEEHDANMMDNLYWWGIPTLFRCPQDQLGETIAVIHAAKGTTIIGGDV